MRDPALSTLAIAGLLAATAAACDSAPTTNPGECTESGPADASAQGDNPSTPLAEQGPIAPTQAHPFSILDMLAMSRISSPLPSPDGKQIAFVRRDTDMEADRGRTSLWIMDTAGSEPRQLVEFADGAGSPAWAPDGKKLYFLSSRSGSSQVWRVPAAGGELTRITELPVSVANLVLSPDGTRLVVSASLVPTCADLECTAKAASDREASKISGEVYDRVFMRHWDHWKDGTRSQLLAVELDGEGLAQDPGKATILTRGLDADVPSSPFGGREEISFTPDSSSVIFAARDAQGKNDEAWSTNFDLWLAPVDASAAPKKLTENPAWDTHPVFSPDGKTLAYVAMERPGYEADRFRVILRNWADGSERVLTEKWDRSVRDLGFAPDGKSLIVTAQDTGHVPIFSIDLASGDAKKLVAGATASSPSVAGDRLVFLQNDLSHPNEVWTAALDGSDRKALTHVNDALVAKAQVGAAEQFSFKGAKGDEVFGWVVKPANFDPEQTYPLAFLIHGGPQGSFGNRFHYRWNPQTYAGAGYAVVMIDFHGSTGYGQDFTDAIRNDWGGKPLTDLKKGLAHVEKNYAWIDTERSCALGASYGGYMINWIAGNWPDRFKCLVNHDGIFDQRMMYYATEELWFPEWEHKGPYHGNEKSYERHNPANFVEKWKTPMLVVHGSLDYRVPVEQGIATFTALQRLGIESQFLHYPDENHWVLRPSNSQHWHDTVDAWLARHLGN
jgi:dipeptidyl aminopeptidase/acylaminoacyl peptidase